MGPVSLRYVSVHQVPTGNGLEPLKICAVTKITGLQKLNILRGTYEIKPFAKVGTAYLAFQESLTRGTACIYAYMKSLVVDRFKMADGVVFPLRVVGAE